MKFQYLNFVNIFGVILVFFLFFTQFTQIAFGLNIDDIKKQIDIKNTSIKELEAEIVKYQGEILTLSKTGKSLQSNIKIYDSSINKLTADIKLTENKIDKTNLEIKQLAIKIGDKADEIKSMHDSLASSLQEGFIEEQNTLFETLLINNTLSEFSDKIEKLNTFQSSIEKNSKNLKIKKQNLKLNKNEVETKKLKLVEYKNDLSNQKKIVEISKVEKKKLLFETKNKQSEFAKILAERQKIKEQFEKELFGFESQLKIAINPSLYSGARINWPLDNVRITQLFGKTVAAQKLYVSGSHSGVDFGAPVGTKVKAVKGGIVIGVGDTGVVQNCYSYGKWILIKHNNGLSSVYAHLSYTSVNEGQNVDDGQIIGYSGNTGYSTGPHLHLGIWASQGVKVEIYTKGKYCNGLKMPIAPPNAYLNPMAYLPSL